MKIYNNTQFQILEKGDNGVWDYLISDRGFEFPVIEGLLRLNHKEKMALLDILERSSGDQAVFIGDKEYGFIYIGESPTQDRKYRLINARYEDISVTNLEYTITENKKEERQKKFKENLKKAGFWKEEVK